MSVADEQGPSIQGALGQAIRHHNSGRLSHAEDIYRQILQTDPNQPVALHLLGLIAHQLENYHAAADLIMKAIALKPDYAEAHCDLGLTFHEQGRFDEATASYQKALSILPDLAVAHCNLGLTLESLGKLDESVSSYQKSIAIAPQFAEAHNSLGNAFDKMGRLDEAVASYQKAIAINPNFAEAHNNLGNGFDKLGRAEEAMASYRKALAIRPDFAGAYYNLHALLLDSGDLEPSIKCIENAVKIIPQNSSWRFILGLLLDYSGNPKEAASHFDLIEIEDTLNRAKLDAWRYLKSTNKILPTIIGSSIQAFELGINAAIDHGLVLEFGVRFGTSIRQIAALVGQEVHGFDSFEGLPEAWHNEPKGSYSTNRYIPTVPENVILHDGWFEDSLPEFVQNYRSPIRFINIDCDIYSSTRTILECLANQIVPGTVMVFDEYIGNENWREDEFKAFQEAVQNYGWKYEYLCFSFTTNQVVIRIF